MALTFYNTLTKKTEPFVPLDPAGKKVGLYTCGPTVYNYAHIGNFRAYIFADSLKRSLTYCGYEVNHVMNLTDVDDKTIRDSRAASKTLEDFTAYFAEEFKKDAGSLNILPPNTYARAVEHIPQMVALIEKLIKKGYAYKSDDGSVYFDIHRDEEYGQLSLVAVGEQRANAAGRIKLDEYEKDSANDFALWKTWDPSDGDVFWETSLGKGRPGWHIECSAMSMEYLGESFDIHTGGVDLIFPHHENEIAQSECASGKKFVDYWLHNEWVMVEGKKMSKSAGNFVTLLTIQERGINPLAFRLLILMSHYRSPLNFTWEALEAAEIGLKHLYSYFLELPADGEGKIIDHQKKRFTDFIEGDLGTPGAIVVMWSITNTDETTSPEDKRATLLDFDKVLGLGLAGLKKEKIPNEINALATEREQARKEKNWARSDELRAQIEASGYVVKDTDSGPRIEKK